LNELRKQKNEKERKNKRLKSKKLRKQKGIKQTLGNEGLKIEWMN